MSVKRLFVSVGAIKRAFYRGKGPSKNPLKSTISLPNPYDYGIKVVISKSRRWTLTKSELLGTLATETGLKKKDVDNVMQALRSTIYKTLKTEHKIKLDGLGVFQLKDRKARQARNPRTGELVNVPAKKVVKFRVLKDLKEAVLS
jgi:DNA-binding protein HU-beta